MKIAFATCSEKSQLTQDDQKVAFLLRAMGIVVEPLLWGQGPIEGFDAILIRSTWDYHKRYAEFLEWINRIENSSTQLINSPGIVKWNSNKSYLVELESQGIACIPSLLATTSDRGLIADIQNRGWSEVVVKSTVGATAHLTYRSSVSASRFLNLVCEAGRDSKVLIQPYLQSIESEGEVSLIFFNSRSLSFSHAVLKKPKAGDFRVQSDFGGVESKIEPDLFLRHSENSYSHFAQAIVKAISH